MKKNKNLDDVLKEKFSQSELSVNSDLVKERLKKIMYNTVISYYKKDIKAESDLTMDISIEPEKEVVDIADGLRVEELHLLINRMPVGHRFVFNLYAIDGYSHKEIAAMLDIDETTSATIFLRAKKYLSMLIKEAVQNEKS